MEQENGTRIWDKTWIMKMEQEMEQDMVQEMEQKLEQEYRSQTGPRKWNQKLERGSGARE